MMYFSRLGGLAISKRDHPVFGDNKRVVVDSIICRENSARQIGPDFQKSGAISRISEFG
jgi:hypothetical protein